MACGSALRNAALALTLRLLLGLGLDLEAAPTSAPKRTLTPAPGERAPLHARAHTLPAAPPLHALIASLLAAPPVHRGHAPGAWL